MKNSKKAIKKFTARSSIQKRDRRDRARRELMRAIEQTNVPADAVKIKISDDRSYGGRREFGGKTVEVEGVFSQAASGFGFVRTDGDERDIFIPASHIGNALDGDTVACVYKRFTGYDGTERTEGRITEIKKEERRFVIGTVYSETLRVHRQRIERYYVIADDPKILHKVYLVNAEGAVVGDKVEVKLKRASLRFGYLEGELVANFGESLSKEANYRAILAECGIDTEFRDSELDAAEKSAARPIVGDGRHVRSETIFTIDSESAKDLDDAVSLIRKPGGKWCLGVHIADVSEYVEEKSALERLAMARGTSVYFTDKVVPMLPRTLSNGACSLNPGEKRYALSAMITLSDKGDILDVELEESVITSKLKGIYSEVNAIFDGTADGQTKAKYKAVLPSLERMRELYLILAEKSRSRGALELESTEAEIILGDDGYVSDIVKRERGDAERMIEQFMLTANEAVATLLYNEGIPCVYRVHDTPPEDKMESFINYAHNLGFDTSYINHDKASSKDLCRLLDESKERGCFEAVSYNMLRAMSKALYSEIPAPHYGLGIEHYCHFTSPIRRLSDLATHRIIKKVLLRRDAAQKYRSYAKRAAAAATEGELRAVSAERRIENLYKVIYMSDRIGEVFDAKISAATQHGIFALLDNTCEGLVPISDIGYGAYFDEKNFSIVYGNAVYRTADNIKIRLEEADITKGKLRFSLA